MPKAIDWMDVLTRWFSLPLGKKQEYTRIAAGFSRCAVGEQRQRFPKVVVYSLQNSFSGSERVPVDSELYDLGYDFYSCLSNATNMAQTGERQFEADNIAEATNVVTKIRARVAALKEAAK